MKVLTIPVGPLQANCYVVWDGQSAACVVIDPGGDAEDILRACQAEGLSPQAIILTHGHVDHMAGAAALKERTGARVLAHAGDREAIESPHPYWVQMVGEAPAVVVDEALEDGQELTVGGLTLRVLHTPGHSPGCVCLLAEGAIFTGDTLFAGSVGRTDFPGGSTKTLEQSLERIVNETAPDTVVYPGHGPSSTMAEEISTNPWLQ